ncbi:unnamed protein product, partial [Linum tenue]
SGLRVTTSTGLHRRRAFAQGGGLGAPLLPHQLLNHRHPRRRAQRQARSHHRDMGAPEGDIGFRSFRLKQEKGKSRILVGYEIFPVCYFFGN